MDFDHVFRTILRDNPGLKSKFLIEEAMKVTGRERSAVWEHLKSAVNRTEVIREKGHYYLQSPEGEARRAREKHRKEIISGLLVLAGSGKYTMTGEIVPNHMKAEFARQHLESGYPSIPSLTLDNNDSERKRERMLLFLDRVQRLIEVLKLGDKELKGHCEDCSHRL